MGRVSEKRRVEERRSEKRKSQNKEAADARKGRKVAKHCVFPMIFGSGGLKSRLAKAAGAEPPGQMRDEQLHAVVARSTFRSQNVQNTRGPDHFWKLRCRKKCTPLWRKAHFEVKMYKTHHVRTTFGSCDVEKVHAVVARNTFRSQNVQKSSYQGVSQFFHSTCLKYCACHEKVMPGHTKCCTCHAKSSQQTYRSDAPKCNSSQEISARTS